MGNITASGDYILYNHLIMTVKTHHVTAGDEVRIVGFEVEQKSVQAGYGKSLSNVNLADAPPQIIRYRNGTYADITRGIIFSYEIRTVNDDTTTWASRMDHYYQIGKYDVHAS